MEHPTAADVDLGALRDNFRAIQHLVRERSRESLSADSGAKRTPDPFIIAVVKANAYGHGAVAVGRALEDAGATMLACADIEEGVELRAAGIGIPVLVFGALGPSDVASPRRTGRRPHRRARDDGRHRDDPVRGAVPARKPNQAGLY